jgi:peroxiredoxin
MVDHDEFERLNVQLLAISGDNTFSQQMFASSLQLNYPVLSDYPNLKIIDHYGVLQRIGKADRPVAKGSYFLVDMQGIVRGKWMNPPGEVVPNETFLKARREIAP